MRPQRDPILTALCKRFSPLCPIVDRSGEYDRILNDRDKLHLKNVAWMPGFRVARVQLYLGGLQRPLAYGKADLWKDLARFADLCTIHFSKYRMRKQFLDDLDFNTTKELAEKDYADLLEFSPDLLSLLQDIEKHLLSTGALTPLAKPTNDKPKRRTLSTEMDTFVKNLSLLVNDSMTDLMARADHTERLVERLEVKLDQIAARLRELTIALPIGSPAPAPAPAPPIIVVPVPTTPTTTDPKPDPFSPPFTVTCHTDFPTQTPPDVPFA